MLSEIYAEMRDAARQEAISRLVATSTSDQWYNGALFTSIGIYYKQIVTPVVNRGGR